MATTEMIREVEEDVYSASNITKTLSIPGYKAGISHNFDSLMPCWQYLPGFLRDTNYQNPCDMMHTPFQLGHKMDQPAFVWALSQPERLQDFNLWMTATHEGQKSWLDVFPPEKFCVGSDRNTVLFVDIGGGVGHHAPIQDMPHAIEHAIPTKGVESTVFDFWGDQPVKGARAYYLRNIIHDYPDDKAIQLLQKTVTAMGEDSIIIIDDMIVPDSGAHWHAAQQDLTMMSTLASMERSTRQWRSLLEKAGLKVQAMIPYTDQTRDSVIVVVPEQ